MRKNYHIGEKFNNLLILEKSYRRTKHGKIMVKCLCDCGNKKEIQVSTILNGHSKSCGCIKNKPVHGGCAGYKKSPTYSSYQAMKSRCLNQNDPMFYLYGGRGISICDKWKNSFEEFQKDMGYRPANKTLERKNTNGNYEPCNCVWITAKDQARNRRTNKHFTVRGINGCLAFLCEHFGVPYERTRARLAAGNSVEDAFFKPYHSLRPLRQVCCQN